MQHFVYLEVVFIASFKCKFFCLCYKKVLKKLVAFDIGFVSEQGRYMQNPNYICALRTYALLKRYRGCRFILS